MAASNTNILIKRSLLSGNAYPSLLKQGELAYSYNSNTLFIGTEGSDGYLEIGSHSELTSNITSISGSTTYGSTTAIPKITVDKHGVIVDITTSTISTALTVAGDSGSDTVNLGTDTLTLSGGEGITSTASGTSVTFDVDDTVVRSNTTGNQTIDGTLNISGNLNVTGTSTFIDTVNLVVEEPMIFLANNNTSGDVVDIGFAGIYNNGAANVWTGLIRHAGDSDRKYHLFQEYTLDANNGSFDIQTANAQYATLQVNRAILDNGATLSDNNYSSISFGFESTARSQGCTSIAIGADAGLCQGSDAVALGTNAGKGGQYNGTVAIGGNAGENLQLCNSIAIGLGSGQTQAWDAVALGRSAGALNQSYYSIAIGAYTGQTCQGYKAVAIGRYAGQCNQQYQAVALGTEAGRYSQTDCAVAIGAFAGRTCQGYDAVAVGNSAGYYRQQQFTVAVGHNAGRCCQHTAAVAVGHAAGEYCQQADSVAIGVASGRCNQQSQAVAIGNRAGHCCQQSQAVAIGNAAGYNNQGQNAIAIGNGAGYGCSFSQGSFSIAIGANAGHCQTAEHSIILNATGSNLNSENAGFYVNPIRNDVAGGNVTAYNTTTKELVDTNVKISNTGITLANGTSITDTAGSSNVYIKFLQQTTNTGNVAFYDPTTGELSYNTLGDLHPYEIANGAYAWSVDTLGDLNGPGGGKLRDENSSVVFGHNIDDYNTNVDRVAIGNYAGASCQSCGAVAVGSGAGQNHQACNAIAVGYQSGQSQNWDAVAVGRSAGHYQQREYSVAIGAYTGQTCQGYKAVAIGRYAGQCNQQYQSVAIGAEAGRYGQCDDAVAIGAFAGSYHQGYKSIAVGSGAGKCCQQSWSVAVGLNAGNNNQGHSSVALGHVAGFVCQGTDAVALGVGAGNYHQGNHAVAIGNRAGYGNCCSQGEYAIAIGAYAGYDAQYSHSIILNASGSHLNAANAGFYVSATRYEETQEDIDGIAFYNPTTKEMRYSYTLDGGVF